MKFIGAAVVLAGSMAGCVQQAPPNTPSRQPEVTLTDVDLQCVHAGLLNRMVNGGFQIKQATDTMIIGGRVTQDVAATLLYSTRYSGAPEERIIFTIISPAPHTARVVLTGALVSNAGTAFERSNAMGANQQNQNDFANGMRKVGQECRLKDAPSQDAPPKPLPTGPSVKASPVTLR